MARPAEVLDVLVLGAGPAGGAAAYHLARKGHRVRILERAPLPRLKPCGGGVSPQVAGWFGFSFDPVISARVTRARFTLCGERPVTCDLGTREPLWMVRRSAFDHFLAGQAVAAGAELKDGCAALGLRREAEAWRVETEAGPMWTRLLVAADGANGPAAKWLGFGRRARRVAGALEGESPVVPGEAMVHFDFGTVARGYQWNFPKADGWSIGSGVFLGGGTKDLRASFETYCGSLGLDPAACRVLGHPLLLWDGPQALHHEAGALLAGEAACLVDPFTAEGIRPALRSGVLAAEALHRVLDGDPGGLAAYSEAVQRELGSEFAWARRLAQVFYRFPSLGYRVAIEHPRGPQRMAQIITGERSYQDVARGALAKLGFFNPGAGPRSSQDI